MQSISILVIGLGEIGEPIFNILRETYPQTDSFDIKQDLLGERKKYDIIHICFGYKVGEKEQYKKWVKEYQDRFLKEGGLTVIHATVEPGMSRSLNAIHSPVVGQHPNMEPGIRTFVKYFGGERASEAAEYFRRAGIKVYITDKPEATELMKILDTTFYSLCIEWTKEVKRQCQKYEVPFELWSIWVENYNKGYQKLDHPEFTRPNLVPIMKPQGGHCTIPNLEFLDSPFSDFIKKSNKRYG